MFPYVGLGLTTIASTPPLAQSFQESLPLSSTRCQGLGLQTKATIQCQELGTWIKAKTKFQDRQGLQTLLKAKQPQHQSSQVPQY